MMAENNFKIMNARFTFRNVPMHKLEKYQFKDIDTICHEFKKISDVTECVIIQTASRVEAFLVANLDETQTSDENSSVTLTINEIKKVWVANTELSDWEIDHFDQTMEVYTGRQIYENLLKLATGLQSVVVGKREILDQIRESIANAKQAGHSGSVLNKLFDTVLRISSKIRADTGMGDYVRSIGDIAVKIADENAGIDAKKKILLLGTGETAARVAKALNRKQIGFNVASMQIERAQGFSKILQGTPVDFEEAIIAFDKFDIVFVATTADYFILEHDQIKRQMDAKKTGTMIIDISDPRAVADDVSYSPGVKLMFRDQIEEQYIEIQRESESKIPAVKKAIVKEVPIIEATMNRVHAEPKVTDVFAKVDQLRERELKKALEQLGDIDEKKIKVIEELTRSVVENIVTVPKSSDDE